MRTFTDELEGPDPTLSKRINEWNTEKKQNRWRIFALSLNVGLLAVNYSNSAAVLIYLRPEINSLQHEASKAIQATCQGSAHTGCVQPGRASESVATSCGSLNAGRSTRTRGPPACQGSGGGGVSLPPLSPSTLSTLKINHWYKIFWQRHLLSIGRDDGKTG